jgi:hypothetical protein
LEITLGLTRATMPYITKMWRRHKYPRVSFQ